METTPDETDAVLLEIESARTRDGPAARAELARLWAQIGPAGDPLHRCALAHHAADVQEDLREELRWDLRALAAADELTDERAQLAHPSLTVAGLYPSLHLNLADVYRRLGDPTRARHHLARARGASGALAEDGYGRTVRDGIARCADRLGCG